MRGNTEHPPALARVGPGIVQAGQGEDPGVGLSPGKHSVTPVEFRDRNMARRCIASNGDVCGLDDRVGDSHRPSLDDSIISVRELFDEDFERCPSIGQEEIENVCAVVEVTNFDDLLPAPDCFEEGIRTVVEDADEVNLGTLTEPRKTFFFIVNRGGGERNSCIARRV